MIRNLLRQRFGRGQFWQPPRGASGRTLSLPTVIPRDEAQTVSGTRMILRRIHTSRVPSR